MSNDKLRDGATERRRLQLKRNRAVLWSAWLGLCMKATKEIIKQIDDLFGDTSVSQRTTLKALEEIRDELDFKISALQEDIKRAEKES